MPLKEMMHVIVYDIANERRLRRVAILCEDFGIRVEKSVFECNLEKDQYEEFWSRLQHLICEDSDRVIDYPIDEKNQKAIRTIGVMSRPEKGAYVF